MMPDDESQGPVIRDRRRIDPATGQVRQNPDSGSLRGQGPAGSQPRPGKHSVSTPGGTPAGSGADPETAGGPGPAPGGAAAGGAGEDPPAGNGGNGADPELAKTTAMLAERTLDLQRLQAEYANYRKRVERDRQAVREQALASVLSGLLPVLDDIGRAREHGELTGAFKSVGESLETIVAKLGLVTYGESGEPFDPTLHEALLHSYSPEVTEPTCVQILQPGYKVGERIIRPARVAVAEPGDGDLAAGPDSDEAGSDGTPGEGAAGEDAPGQN
jgi:molecular chaperone GrpE